MYLRPYEAKDLDALYALDLACFEPRFRFSRSMMRTVVSVTNAVVNLACELDSDGGEIVAGFVVISLEVADTSVFGYVSTLDVAPQRRGQGVGSALMRAAEDEAVRLGAAWMELHVFVENGAAQHLYERLGYIREGRAQAFYGAGVDAWVYRKPLRSAP